METAILAASENRLISNQPLTDSSMSMSDSTEVESPFSEPRKDPTDQSLPEILVTDFSYDKSGLLDWSVSCPSISAISSDLPQDDSVGKSGDESRNWTETCAHADSNVNGSTSVREEAVVPVNPDLKVLSSEDIQPQETSSFGPLSTISLVTSESGSPNHVTYLNGLDSSDDRPSLRGEAFQRESSEPPGGDSDEEYFEEFHLPNTHENAFVRHLSFRRKVQTIPIHAPDADRIEGLVRTGEFARHGSIRKKILPEEPLHEQYEDEEGMEYEEGSGNDSSFTERIERELRGIERYLSEGNLADEVGAATPNNTTSTPKSNPAMYRQRGDGEERESESSFPKSEFLEPHLEEGEDEGESSNIEESTIRKIQECLDFSKYRDMLNMSGRLSDILSPQEVEEVLLHSERYRNYLDSEIIEALSLSFKNHSQSLPYTVNTTTSPRTNDSPAKCATTSNSSSVVSPKSPTKENDASDETPAASDLRFVRRSSTAFEGIEATGIFVEAAPNTNSELRRIPAPRINLDWTSDSKHDSTSDGESFHVESFEEEKATPSSRKRICVSSGEFLNESDAHDDFIAIASEATECNTALHDDFSAIPTGRSPGEMSLAPPPPDLIPELTVTEEFAEMRHWRNVVIGGAWRRIDMRVIAPYRKCVSHGGYMENGQSPIVVLSAALLPQRSRKDYHYVMDNLFIYVLSFLEQLVADDYVLVYFSEDLNQHSAPGFHWLRRAYQMLDRRLRKNLKALLLVHPSLWARTIVTLSRPFVSSKFYRKLHFVRHLIDLAQLLPLEQLEIPEIVKQADFEIVIREKKSGRTRR